MSWVVAVAMVSAGIGAAATIHGKIAKVEGSSLYAVCGVMVGMGVFIAGHARVSSPPPDPDEPTVTIMPWDVILDGDTGQVVKSPDLSPPEEPEPVEQDK